MVPFPSGEIVEGVVRVTYRYIRPMTVFYARAMGPYEVSCREAWSRMNGWLDRCSARSRVKQGYGYFRDNPRLTAPELLRYDACVPVTFGLDPEPDSGIGRQTLPGGAYAVYTHVGSYSEIGGLFSRLHSEIVPKRGLTLDYDRPFATIYLNDPSITREMHRRCELCVPVLPVRMPLSGNDDDAGHSGDQAVVDFHAKRMTG
jgi:AraC family transcriptional regulator